MLTTLLLSSLAFAGERVVPEAPWTAGEYTVTASGLSYWDQVVGTGEAPEAGSKVTCEYALFLEDGTLVDSSYNRPGALTFDVGVGQVLPGWDEGVMGMVEGGKRQLLIPSNLAYGDQGRPPTVPGGATLVFDVELLDVKHPRRAPAAPQQVDPAIVVTTPSGLQYADLVVGDGARPRKGQMIRVEYTGWLTDGTKFDSSLDRAVPLEFRLGLKQVIAGWDEGVSTMAVGGKRQLIIPPDIGYGGRRAGLIPPNSTLVFEVELVDIVQ